MSAVYELAERLAAAIGAVEAGDTDDALEILRDLAQDAARAAIEGDES